MWGTEQLNEPQRLLLGEALEFMRGHLGGLPEDLYETLVGLLSLNCVRLREMKPRARVVKVPGSLARLELNASALGLETIYDHRKALAALPESPDRPEREALIMAKAGQSWLYLSAALVHEGTHLSEGLSLSRQQDEKTAYRAELRFLANVHAAANHPLLRNAARSLHDDAIRDAASQEGLKLEPLLEGP